MNYSLNDERCDAELFHSGDAVRAYRFLGAHPGCRDGKDGVWFRVWAPNALGVSVAGDFNGWNTEANYMNKTDGGIWEAFVEEAKPFSIYKYCIETPYSEKIMKSDPFAFYAQVAPGNASVVYDLGGYKWSDEKWFESRNKKDSLKEPVNIYEIHFGSWRRNEDGGFYSYRQMARELVAYVKDMGYTHVQFMPLAEFPFDGSWGFQTTGYYAATSRYGTPDDLRCLINELHNAGIGVIMDWVPSNFPKDDFGLYRFDGTALFENENPLLGERPSWGTCLFDFSCSEVVSFLVSAAVFWIDAYHIDGIRIGALSSMLFLDYEKTDDEWVPNEYGGNENLEAIDFIKRLNTAVHLHYPKTMVFAEEHTGWSKLSHSISDGGLGFDYKWNIGWMNDMLHYMSLNPLWRPFNHNNLTSSFFYAFSEHYLLPVSHDIVSHGNGSLIGKMPGDTDEKFAGVRAFIAYMIAHPGKKLMFMGSEFGQFDEWRSDTGLHWELLSEEKHGQLRDFFRDINKFYLENRPLYELDASWKGFDWIHHDDFTNCVIAFKRTDSDSNDIIAVCNLQPVKRENYNIGVPIYGLYDEVFNSDKLEYGGTGVTNGKGLVPASAEELLGNSSRKIHGCSQGLSLTLPPLSVIYLKCTEILGG